MDCQHGHDAPDSLLEKLHDSQAGSGRHKCAVCAYDAGYRRGETHPTPHDGPDEECQQTLRAPAAVMADLPHSQAGPTRHQCPVCAYRVGFEAARAKIIAKQIGDDVAKTVASALPKEPVN